MDPGKPASRTALVAGATGLVGGALLPILLSAPEYARVFVLGRRPPVGLAALPGAGRATILRTDFNDLDRIVPAVEDVFCCLGTTMARAGSRAAFERVDREYVVALARAARLRGATHLIVISAAGSSTRALSFYSRVKAGMEAEVGKLGYPCVSVLRPSLLLGKRGESRSAERFVQRLAPGLSPALFGPLRRYRPVAASDVAAAMLELARRATPGHHVHHLPLEPRG